MIPQPKDHEEFDSHAPEVQPPPALLNVNPEMIAMARLATGLTQSEWAEAADISQTKLSKLEDGLITTLERKSLELMSEKSGYPVAFFSQPGSRASLGEGFFRKRTSVPAKVFKRMEALINIKRIEVSKLIRKVEMERKERPAWDVDEFTNGAREIARHLRHFWNIPAGPIKDMIRIIEDAGCLVVFFDFGTPKVDGLTVRCDDGTPLILINPNVSLVRQRCTLAHELGHILMHRIPSGNMEDEAFDFGSEFSMPEQEIRPSLFPLNLERLTRLKIKWKASMQWILRWANKMGAVKDSYYRVLMMKISQNGWRKSEPFDSEWPLEQPVLIDEVIEYHTRELKYSSGELMAAINANARSFLREYLKTPTFSVV